MLVYSDELVSERKAREAKAAIDAVCLLAHMWFGGCNTYYRYGCPEFGMYLPGREHMGRP